MTTDLQWSLTWTSYYNNFIILCNEEDCK